MCSLAHSKGEDEEKNNSNNNIKIEVKFNHIWILCMCVCTISSFYVHSTNNNNVASARASAAQACFMCGIFIVLYEKKNDYLLQLFYLWNAYVFESSEFEARSNSIDHSVLRFTKASKVYDEITWKYTCFHLFVCFFQPHNSEISGQLAFQFGYQNMHGI